MAVKKAALWIVGEQKAGDGLASSICFHHVNKCKASVETVISSKK